MGAWGDHIFLPPVQRWALLSYTIFGSKLLEHRENDFFMSHTDLILSLEEQKLGLRKISSSPNPSLIIL